jgi:hypothetical protein
VTVVVRIIAHSLVFTLLQDIHASIHVAHLLCWIKNNASTFTSPDAEKEDDTRSESGNLL